MEQYHQPVIQKFRIDDVAKLIGVSSKILKEWELTLDELIEFPVDSFGASYYTEREIYTLLQFKNYIDEGLELELAKEVMAKHFAVPESNSSIQIMDRSQAVKAIKELKAIITELNQLESNNHENLTHVSETLISEMETYLSDNLGKRDQDLMSAIRELQQAKQVVSATSEYKKKWWKFW